MNSTIPITGTDGPFRVTWTTGSAIKRVEISNSATGERAVGSDWADWDAAYQQALGQLLSVGETARQG